MENCHAQELFTRVAIALDTRFIDGPERMGLRIHNPHWHGRGVKQCGIASLTVDECLIGLLARGDVARYRNKMREATQAVRDRHDFDFQPEFGAVLAVVDKLCAHQFAFFQSCPDPIQFGPPGSGTGQKKRRTALHFCTAVAGLALKGLIDENNLRTQIVHRRSVGDQHQIVQPGQRRFEQFQMPKRFLLQRHVLQGSHQPYCFTVLHQGLCLVTHLEAPPLGSDEFQHHVPGLPVLDSCLLGGTQGQLCLRRIKAQRLLGRQRGNGIDIINTVNLIRADEFHAVQHQFPAADQGHFPGPVEQLGGAGGAQFSALALSDVLHHARPARRLLTRHVVLHPAEIVNPALVPGRRHDAKFNVHRRAGLHGRIAPGFKVRPIIRMNQPQQSGISAVEVSAVKAKHVVHLFGPPERVVAQVKLPVAQAPKALGVLQFFLHKFAVCQLSLKRFAVLLQGLGHEIKTCGDLRKFTAALFFSCRKTHLKVSFLKLTGRRQNFSGGPDNHPPPQPPGDPAPQQSHQRQHAQFLPQMFLTGSDHLSPIQTDNNKKS